MSNVDFHRCTGGKWYKGCPKCVETKNTVTLLTSDMKSYASFEASFFSDHIANNLKLWGMHRCLAKQDKS
jgi:hypothetical protein